MGDYKFLSIDEVAVSPQRIDTEIARRNILRLQQHLFNENLRYTVMATRQRSVTEEELFGDGKNHTNGNDNDSETNNYVSDNIIEELNRNVSNGDVGLCGELPNFLMLERTGSSGSYSETQPSYASGNDEKNDKSECAFSDTDTEVRMRKKKLSQQPDPESSDFKMQYRDKRSISDVHEKRNAYRNSSGGDVFDRSDQVEDDKDGRYLRKSNSLPGNSCVGSSPLSPQGFHSDPSDHTGDTCTNSKLMKETLHKKLSLEGRSVYPAMSQEGPNVKPAIKTYERRNSKPKLNRRVSFQGDDEHKCVIPEKQNADQPKPCMTPTEERRFTFRSSGYGTGSDAGSQDTTGAPRKNSQISQGSSGVWISQESEKVNGTHNVLLEEGYESNAGSSIEITDNVTMKESQRDDSCNTSSTASQITVRRVEDNSVDKQNSASNMQTTSQEVESKPITINSEQDKNDEAAVFLRLKSRDKDPPSEINDLGQIRKSCDPSSFGNLPNFCTLDDPSYQVPSSSMAKVLHYEYRMTQTVIARHCHGEPASTSPGSHFPVTKMPPDGVKSFNPQDGPSEDVLRLEEMLKKDDFSPHQILETLDGLSSSLSPSPTPNTVEKYRRKCTLNFKEFGAEDLVRASRCSCAHCAEISCIKLQEVMHTLGSSHLSTDQYERQKLYFLALYNHNSECEEVKCPVRFCQEITEWQKKDADFTMETIGGTIHKHVNSPCMNIVLENKYTLPVMKLQRSEKKLEIVDFETYLPLFPVGKFGNSIVCKQMETDSLVVVTKYPMMDYKHQLSLYTRIVGLTHPHIVPQLWLLQYEEKIQVCTIFAKGGNLKDYLTSVGKLQWQLAVVYMRQLLSAISHLHSDRYGVIYLYWCSENFVFTNSGRRVIQLGNFNLACPQGHKLDYGSLKACLPYSICPPELIKHNVVDFKSECWGAGCVLYEMLTGRQYLNDLRHENQSIVHGKVTQGTKPDLTDFKKELTTVLDSCWQVDRERRMSVMEIMKTLHTVPLKVS